MPRFIPRHDLTQPLDLAPAGVGAEWIAAGALIIVSLIAVYAVYGRQRAYDKERPHAHIYD